MKSAYKDTISLKALIRRPISKWSMANLSATQVAVFRDERLTEVSAGTVIRELAYLSSIINHARREWGINVPNPEQMRRLRSLEDLGHALRIMRGPRMPGRKPAN